MSAWHEALHKQQALAKFWGSESGRTVLYAVHNKVVRPGHENIAEATRDISVFALMYGECYYWSRGIVDMISVAARNIPGHWALLSSLLPSSNGFFWLSRTFDMQLTDAHKAQLIEKNPDLSEEIAAIETTVRTAALSWTCTDRNGNFVPAPGEADKVTLVNYIVVPPHPDIPVPVPAAPYTIVCGDTLDQLEAENPGVTTETDLKLFAAMLTFLQQKIMMPVRQSPTRAMRRQAEREKRSIPPINVIKLRHHVYKKTGEQSDVEWAWQWVVRGHWRDQWYPSIKRHQPIWISPYMKGPEDKPVKETERMFAVIR